MTLAQTGVGTNPAVSWAGYTSAGEGGVHCAWQRGFANRSVLPGLLDSLLKHRLQNFSPPGLAFLTRYQKTLIFLSWGRVG